MPDRPESKRPQERDFTIDRWEKFPFKRREDPYENRSEDKANNPDQDQYNYEGWEEGAFPNKDVSKEPAEPGKVSPTPASSKKTGSDKK
jgi:hypothetical protein